MKVRRVIVTISQAGKSGKDSIYTFSYPETRIEFTVSQNDKERPDNCLVKIFGISKETYAIFDAKKNAGYVDNQRVEVYYGYDSDLQLVFSGTIDRVIYQFDSGAQTLTMLVTKNTRKFAMMKKTVSMNGEQTIKSAALQIGKTYGYDIKFSDSGNFDSVSIGRVSVTGSFEKAMKSILPKDYGFYTNETGCFIYHKDKSVAREITVWMQNGLLNYPTEDSKQESTTIRTILIPSVESGMKINIPIDEYWFSPVDTGKYKTYVVKNYSSTFRNGIGTTEFECEGGLNI